jgi:hypothetical protein
MIKDTSLFAKLTFAILPVVIPINPHNGKIVQVAKKREGTTEDPESAKNKQLGREIDPSKKYVVKEKLELSVVENDIKAAFNSSGYYLFLNLPQSKGYTLLIRSDSYLSSKNVIDMEQFNDASADKSIVAYIFEKKLLKNTYEDADKGRPFIKSIITYPSKKTVLKAVINKVNTKGFTDNYSEKPVLDAKVFLEKVDGSEDEITPNSITSNVYDFSAFDEMPQIETVDGTYDEAANSFLGKKKFIKFPNQNEAKFELIVQPEQSSENSTTDRLPLELKIEKSMTTSINVLIIE